MTANEPDLGQRLEKVAFTYCKIATVALIAGRYTLPVAAGLAAVLYVAAYVKGKKDTRCWGKYPLAIAAFWVLVVAAWAVWLR